MIPTTNKRVSGTNTVVMAKKKLQTDTATADWRERMRTARKSLPDGVGQQDVIEWVTMKYPALDRLTVASRWRNAWLARVADPEITQAVEKAAAHFIDEKEATTKRLKRQKLSTTI